jgi:hypothetical protein
MTDLPPDPHHRDRLRFEGRDPAFEDECSAELEADDLADWEAARKPLPDPPPVIPFPVKPKP